MSKAKQRKPARSASLELSSLAEAEPVTLVPALIAAWGKARHARLADLVDRVAAHALAASPREPLRASKRVADLAAWQTIEAARDPLDFDRLGAAARGGSQDDVGRQVTALAERDDPRLGGALLALLADPPYAGVKSRALLDTIVGAIAETRDRRLVEPIRELAARYLGIVNSGTGGWLVGKLGAAADQLAELAEPELGALAATCDALEARFGKPVVDAAVGTTKRTLSQLLAEVYAAPADDGPRLVYADALLERGDPRGEFITLQIAKASGALSAEGEARLAELMADRDQLAAWAQPLANGGLCQFERGFPASINLYRSAKSIIGEPAWATIAEVTGIDNQTVARAILDHPAAAGVRSVKTLTIGFFVELCTTPRPWTHVTLRGARLLPGMPWAAVPALDSLDLEVEDPPDRDELAQLALRTLKLDLRADAATALTLPRTLESVMLGGTVLPQIDFARLDRLAELYLTYANAVAVLELPASLRFLELRMRARGSTAPRIVAANLDHLAIRGAHKLPPGGLAALSSITRLALTIDGPLPAGALAGLANVRELYISARDAEPAFLQPVRQLVDLQAFVVCEQPELEGLPIERLRWATLALDRVPAGLPLREAQLAFAGDLAQLVARYPALVSLDLEAGHARLEGLDWSAIVRRLESSRIARIKLSHIFASRGLGLTRDAGGELTRVQLDDVDPVSVAIVRALARVTAIELRGKLPPELLALVQPS